MPEWVFTHSSMLNPFALSLTLLSALALLESAPLAEAAPLVLTTTGEPVLDMHDFVMGFPGAIHTDVFSTPLPSSLSQTGMTGSICWVVTTNGAFTFTPNPAYVSGMFRLELSYKSDGLKDSLGNLAALSTATVTFTGLQGIAAENLVGTANIINNASQFGIEYTFNLPDIAFSFTGFTLSLELPDAVGPYSLSLVEPNETNGRVWAQASTSSMMDPDPGIMLDYQAVPEPSSVALLAGAAFGGFMLHRRSRRTQQHRPLTLR